jgi:glycosyltransferase involved in cell wall biosynthesis
MDISGSESKVPPSLLSVIAPAFNEEGSICRCVEELSKAMQKAGCSAEIIVVNDGSTDGTLSAVRCMRADFTSLRVLSLARNHGKATALREGVRDAEGTTIAFFDADLQYDPADLVMLVSELNDGTDVVTGLRDYRHYHRTRTAFSKIYNKLIKLVFRLEVSDSNCGMKALKRKVADPDFVLKFGLPLMIPLLKLRGFRISEANLSLNERRAGDSKFFRNRSFLGGWKNIRDISYHSGMLLGLVATCPFDRLKSIVNPPPELVSPSFEPEVSVKTDL